jgi:hypothetical protein
MRVHQYLSVAVVGLLLVVLAACGAESTADDEAPVQVVQEFIAAVEEGDSTRALELMEPNEWTPQMAAEWRISSSMVDTLEFQNATYELEETEGDVAHVRFSSLVSYGLQGSAPAEQQMEGVFEVVNIDGEWYIRNMRPEVELDEEAEG